MHENEDWYRQALVDDPEGYLCGCCGNVNMCYDDVGFWYVFIYVFSNPYRAVCYACLCAYYGGCTGDR